MWGFASEVSKAIIDSKDLARFLTDVDQPLFETMFGIDHKTLVQGGKAIVQGGGHLGQVLFAAGSGLADLRAVQDGLQSEIGDLFRPRLTIKAPSKRQLRRHSVTLSRHQTTHINIDDDGADL